MKPETPKDAATWESLKSLDTFMVQKKKVNLNPIRFHITKRRRPWVLYLLVTLLPLGSLASMMLLFGVVDDNHHKGGAQTERIATLPYPQLAEKKENRPTASLSLPMIKNEAFFVELPGSGGMAEPSGLTLAAQPVVEREATLTLKGNSKKKKNFNLKKVETALEELSKDVSMLALSTEKIIRKNQEPVVSVKRISPDSVVASEEVLYEKQ